MLMRTTAIPVLLLKMLKMMRFPVSSHKRQGIMPGKVRKLHSRKHKKVL